jgi:hypothetical protein
MSGSLGVLEESSVRYMSWHGTGYYMAILTKQIRSRLVLVSFCLLQQDDLDCIPLTSQRVIRLLAAPAPAPTGWLAGWPMENCFVWSVARLILFSLWLCQATALFPVRHPAAQLTPEDNTVMVLASREVRHQAVIANGIATASHPPLPLDTRLRRAWASRLPLALSRVVARDGHRELKKLQ